MNADLQEPHDALIDEAAERAGENRILRAAISLSKAPAFHGVRF